MWMFFMQLSLSLMGQYMFIISNKTQISLPPSPTHIYYVKICIQSLAHISKLALTTIGTYAKINASLTFAHCIPPHLPQWVMILCSVFCCKAFLRALRSCFQFTQPIFSLLLGCFYDFWSLHKAYWDQWSGSWACHNLEAASEDSQKGLEMECWARGCDLSLIRAPLRVWVLLVYRMPLFTKSYPDCSAGRDNGALVPLGIFSILFPGSV